MFKHAKKKWNEIFYNFIEREFLPFKPSDTSVTTKRAGEYISIVVGKAKGNNKLKKMHFCYLYGKKNPHSIKLLVQYW